MPGLLVTKRADRVLKRGTEVGLHLLIALSPVFFGAVSDWAYLPARLLILLLTGLTVFRFCVNRTIRPVWTWLGLPAVLFLGYVIFSQVLLPGFILKALSPAAFSHHEEVGQWRDKVEKSILTPLRELTNAPAEGVHTTQVSSTLSLDPWRTHQGFLGLLTALLVFFVAANLGGSRRQTKRFMTTLAGTAGVISVFGLIQGFEGLPLLLWSAPADSRVRGTFINPNHFAFYLEIALPLTFALICSYFLSGGTEEESGWRSAVARFRRGSGPHFVFVVVALAVSSLAFLYTQSRMGMASLFLVAFLGIPLLVRKRRTFALVSFVVLLLAGVLVAKAWVGIDRPLRRLSMAAFGVDKGRLWVWSDTRALRRDFFLAGSGLGTFEIVYPKYRTVKVPLKYSHAHNDFLEVWTETGVIGFGLVLLGIGAAGWEVFRLRRRQQDPFVLLFSGVSVIGLGSVLLHSVGDFGLRIPANAYLFALTGGLTLALLKRSALTSGEAVVREGPSRRWLRPVAATLASALMIGMALDAALGLAASLRFRSAKRGGLGIEERLAVLREVTSFRPKEERYLLARVSAEELRMRLDLVQKPEDGLRSALRALELVARAQRHHPALGDFIFAEGMILRRLERWVARRSGRSMFRSATTQVEEGSNKEVEMVDKLRITVAKFAWEALLRAVSWEPTRLAFHYALGLYGVSRWKKLGLTERQQTKASIAKAAGFAICGDTKKYRILRLMVRRLGDRKLENMVRGIRCVQ